MLFNVAKKSYQNQKNHTYFRW